MTTSAAHSSSQSHHLQNNLLKADIELHTFVNVRSDDDKTMAAAKLGKDGGVQLSVFPEELGPEEPATPRYQPLTDEGVEQNNNPDKRMLLCGRFHFPYLGLAMAVVSSLFFSLCSLIVKKLDNIHPMELATFRFIGILIPALSICVYYNKSPIGPPGSRFFLLLRGILGACGLMTQFYAIRHMPLADASVIIFSAPVFTTIFARIFLKEPCGIFNIVVIVFTLLGVVLITKPPMIFGSVALDQGYTTQGLYGAIVAFVSTIFAANVYVLVRKLKHVHYSVIMMSFAVIAILISHSFTEILGEFCIPPCGFERQLIVLLGLFSFLGQILLTKALQYEQAGPVSICRTVDIVFAFCWQVLFFNEVPNAFSVLGAILVTGSVLVVGLRKWLMSLPEGAKAKRKLRFLLI